MDFLDSFDSDSARQVSKSAETERKTMGFDSAAFVRKNASRKSPAEIERERRVE